MRVSAGSEHALALRIDRALRRFLPNQRDLEMLLRMRLPSPLLLGAIYVLSELWLILTRRSGARETARDRKTLPVLWIVIAVSMIIGSQADQWIPSAGMPHPHSLRAIGFGLFVAGLALRWYAIGYLGKFFTVNVAVHSEHQLIEAGPYRFVRHPSYTGALIAFLGLSLSMANWASFAIIMIPIFLAFLLRIYVEERALAQAMGERYRSYQRRTKRLIPALY